MRDVMQRAYDSGRHARRGLFRVVDDVRACVDARPKLSKFEHVRFWPISCFTYLAEIEWCSAQPLALRPALSGRNERNRPVAARVFKRRGRDEGLRRKVLSDRHRSSAYALVIDARNLTRRSRALRTDVRECGELQVSSRFFQVEVCVVVLGLSGVT